MVGAEPPTVATDDHVIGADADRISDAVLLDGGYEAEDVRIVQGLGAVDLIVLWTGAKIEKTDFSQTFCLNLFAASSTSALRLAMLATTACRRSAFSRSCSDMAQSPLGDTMKA
jgi:hypothetical protein